MHPEAILKSLQVSARKSLSQNFLTSPHWADTLTNFAAAPKNVDEYWEIGPGLGALTERLIQKVKKPVRLFEYDRAFAKHLREIFPKTELVEADFLKTDLSQVTAKSVSVLSNLPYHISSPIFFKLLDEKARIARMVLTFQKEFAERLVALPRTKAYGSLSIVAQLHYTIESIGVLPKGAFYPTPAVASEALLLEPREASKESDLSVVQRVLRVAFAHRRKKLIGNLKNLSRQIPWEDVFKKLQLKETVRAEELEKEEYVELTREAVNLGLTVQ